MMIKLSLTGQLFTGISQGEAQFQKLFAIWAIIMISVVIVTFIVSELTGNYSQVDKLWSIIPIAYSWVAFSVSHSKRLLIMALLVTIWGLRLSYNFYRKGGYSIIPWRGEEDYRWKIMRENPALKGRLRFGLFNLLFISLYQNLLILLFSSPLLIASVHAGKALNITDLFAGILMLFFIFTEGIADNQLFRFHTAKNMGSDPGGRFSASLAAGFMKDGMWRFSRHPNFASEQAIWICFYFFGVAASGKWINITIIGPLLLVILFLGSSQLTENISSGKYPGYAGYRKDVPRFIPKLFKRH